MCSFINVSNYVFVHLFKCYVINYFLLFILLFNYIIVIPNTVYLQHFIQIFVILVLQFLCQY